MRVLFIARYRDPTMDRKVLYLAASEGVIVRQVRPANWHDDLLAGSPVASNGQVEQVSIPLVGRPNDPHRSVYRTLTFGLRQFRPDIIHAEEEPDSLAALQITLARRWLAPRAKLILNTWQNVDRPRRAEVRWVTRQCLEAADAVFCANQDAQGILRAHGYGGYTGVLPAVGVDTDVFQPCSGQQPAASDRFTIGYIGRLIPEKGIGTLLQALTQLGPAFHLRLIGAGPGRPALEAQVAALHLEGRVQFVAPMPPAQVAQQYCQLDALVLPSLTTPVWKEQFGRVLTEAMACRVPVVGSSSGAIPEVVDEAGLIFPEGEARALADCLRRLQSSPELRQALVDQGEARVRRRYTQSVIAQDTVAVYRHLLNEAASA
jgi:glycosyltransferase involved in cell wall biosynthesis